MGFINPPECTEPDRARNTRERLRRRVREGHFQNRYTLRRDSLAPRQNRSRMKGIIIRESKCLRYSTMDVFTYTPLVACHAYWLDSVSPTQQHTRHKWGLRLAGTSTTRFCGNRINREALWGGLQSARGDLIDADDLTGLRRISTYRRGELPGIQLASTSKLSKCLQIKILKNWLTGRCALPHPKVVLVSGLP